MTTGSDDERADREGRSDPSADEFEWVGSHSERSPPDEPDEAEEPAETDQLESEPEFESQTESQSASTADDEWRFSIDEVGPDAEANEEDAPAVFTRPIEPESISIENAVFVALGVALTIVVIVTAV